jgi:hypothetical protein
LAALNAILVIVVPHGGEFPGNDVVVHRALCRGTHR